MPTHTDTHIDTDTQKHTYLEAHVLDLASGEVASLLINGNAGDIVGVFGEDGLLLVVTKRIE